MIKIVIPIKQFFGYGSLMDPESLLATAPDATDIRACYVKGFRRNFNLWDPIGWTETNLDLAGMPMCALDVEKDTNPDSVVNGIVFSVGGESVSRLLEREENYSLIETQAYDFETSQPIGVCGLFSACKRNGKYDFNSPAQARYLQICLESAKQHGDRFLKDFLDSTFIHGIRLGEYKELVGGQ